MGSWPPLSGSLQDALVVPTNADTTFSEDVRSANWDGGGSLASGADTAATQGYLIDYSTGSAQFMGDIWSGGNIELIGGGIIRTAPSGARAELKSGAYAPYLELYSDTPNLDRPPRIYSGSVTSSTEVPRMRIKSGRTVSGGSASENLIELRADGGLGSMISIVADTVSIGGGSATSWTGVADFSATVVQVYKDIDHTGDLTTNQLLFYGVGSAASPLVSLRSNDGLYSRVNDEINFATAGVEKMRLTSGGDLHIAGSRMYFDTIAGDDYIQIPDGSNYFRVMLDTAERMRVNTSGDLHISGDQVVFGINSDDYIQMPEASDYFRVMLDGTQRLKIDTAGALTVTSWVGDLLMSGDQIKFGSSISDYIQRSEGSNYFRMVQDSTETHRFDEDGDLHIAGTKVYMNTIGGTDYISFADTTNQFKLVINGADEMILGTSGFLVPNVYSSTTSATANVYVASDGRLYRTI